MTTRVVRPVCGTQHGNRDEPGRSPSPARTSTPWKYPPRSLFRPRWRGYAKGCTGRPARRQSVRAFRILPFQGAAYSQPMQFVTCASSRCAIVAWRRTRPFKIAGQRARRRCEAGCAGGSDEILTVGFEAFDERVPDPSTDQLLPHGRATVGQGESLSHLHFGEGGAAAEAVVQKIPVTPSLLLVLARPPDEKFPGT